MRTQYRNKKTIYLCKQYQDGKLTKYYPPIKLKENYAVTTNNSDMLIMGMDYSKRLRIKTGTRTKVDDTWHNTVELYHQGDRVYVYVEPPITHDDFCKDADYEVELKPNATLNQVDIVLRNLSGK